MRRQLASRAGPAPARLGVRWREESGGSLGIQLVSVDAGTPADAAQLQPGDRIVRLGEQKIDSGETLQRAVFYASGPTPLLVKRHGESKPRKITAKLPKQPLRVGITWRVDSAAPHAVVLTRIVAGSPADRAGLRPGDRVYQVDGKDFADEKEFAKRLTAPSDTIELLIDRHGRLETIVLHLDASPVKRAA
jgi:C-terminal processing protease CtpA/Prc